MIAGGFLLLGLACGRPASPDDLAELAAESPCFRVDLVDGLADADEVDELFGCLDRYGHLAPLRPAAAALQEETLGSRPADHLADAQRAAMQAGADPLAGAAVVAAWLTEDDLPTRGMLDAVAELATGQSADALRIAPALATDLSASPWVVLAPEVPGMAASLREQPRALGELATLLDDEAVPLWAAGLAAASEAEGVDAWLREAGRAVDASRSPHNDRHPDASGDSLRDLVETWLLRDEPVLQALAPPLQALLDAPGLGDDLAAAVHEVHQAELLEHVPASAAWLAEQSIDTAPVTHNHPSALHRFVRLLATTNEPIDCELDLWLTSFEWSVPNLAVRVLQLVSQLQPGEAQELASFLGDLSDSALTEAVLELAIDSGTCPTLTHETLDDLAAVTVLQETEAEPLLVALIEVLQVADAHGALPDVADAVQATYDEGGLPPLEEALRDVGPTLAAGGLARMVGALARPEAHGLAAEPNLAGGMEATRRLVSAPERVVDLQGLARSVLDTDATWEALGRVADVLATDGQLAHGLALYRQLYAHDPSLSLFAPARTWITDAPTIDAALLVLSDPEVVDALLAEWPSDDGPPPLGWLAQSLVDGTIEDLAMQIATLLADAGTPQESP